jgi:hypothetical protein
MGIQTGDIQTGAILTDYYQLTPYKNLLHIEAYSFWDERVSLQLLIDIKRLALHLYQDTKWGILADNRNWGLHTPESEQFIREWSQAKPATPLTHHAVVVGQSELKKWQIQSIFNDAKTFETKLFGSLSEAKVWLASFGYTMEP